MTSEEFDKLHPYPDENNVSALFRFMSINSEDPEFIEHLFLQKKLYHSLAQNFNDPFEDQPVFHLSHNNPEQIRNHFFKILRREGIKRKEALARVGPAMHPNNLNKLVSDSKDNLFNYLRICCFANNKKNLLLWAHYAASHKGFCVEFDAATVPIMMTQKVHYTNERPQWKVPVPPGKLAFSAFLMKSTDWKYEEEYRSFLLPNKTTLSHDENSLILDPKTITNVYLGTKIEQEDKIVLLDIISRSDFDPKIWQASLSKHTFGLVFKELTL